MEKEKRRKYLSPEETSMFLEQISLVLKSGIPLFDGVEALCENYKESKYAGKFTQLDEKVKQTGSLYEGIEAVDVFPPYMISTIKIAERAGTMDTVTEALGQYYAREGKMRAAIRNAITYPLLLISMMAIIVVVLVVKILPIFTQVFRNLGTDMSAASVNIMNFGMAAGQTVLVLVVIVIALVLAALILLRTKKRAAVMKLIDTAFPPIKRIRDNTSAGRVASVMAMLLKSGFPLEEALSMIPDVLDDEEARSKIGICVKRMEEGGSFPEAISESGLFSGLHNRMIRIGFLAGQMDTVMAKLANIYEDEVDDSIRRMVSLIEPTLVAILSVIIGAVLLAVMLPLASIISSL